MPSPNAPNFRPPASKTCRHDNSALIADTEPRSLMVPRSDMTSPDSRKSVDSLPLSSPKSAASQQTPFQQADSNSKSVSRHRLGSRRSSNASSITSLGSTFHPPLLQQHQQHGSIAETGQNGRICCICYPTQLCYAYVNCYLY